MATINKRGNSYSIRVSDGYDVHGKHIVKSMTWKPEPGMTAKQIEKELNRQAILFEEECKNGKIIVTTKFEEFAEQWFKEYAELKLKTRTLANYRWLSKRTYGAIGHLRIDKITPRHIQNFVLEMNGGERSDLKEGKLTPKTIKLHVSFISTVFDYAMKMQMVSSNPCRLVNLPRKDEKDIEVYTLDEAQRILDLLSLEPIEMIHHVVFFTMAIYTGLRRGELLGLEWKDFDFQNNLVSIKRTSNNTPEKGTYTDTPKTKTSRRTLKLSDDLVKLIQRYQTHQKEIIANVGDKWMETDRLFTKWNGEPMYPNTPYRFFTKFCKRNGLRQLNVHSLRHLNASIMINQGVDVKTVQACLGHSSASTTMNIYLHSFQEAQVRAMDAVSFVFNTKSDENQNSEQIANNS